MAAKGWQSGDAFFEPNANSYASQSPTTAPMLAAPQIGQNSKSAAANVAGTNNETKAKDSPKASANRINRSQCCCSCTRLTTD